MHKLFNRMKLIHWAKLIRKYHAVPVLALAMVIITYGERVHRREESVIGEAFILAEVENLVKFLSGAG